ncbi:hypothetical protein SEA_VINCENZO_82 [Mycobacterium phage Vincenzo]|uniref:Uncharacterized protein n=2 Tax=Coopervirus vincenzo TaxID=1983110 RepID=A0A0F6WE14_9CAUD|nr:hypothetical protein SEA_VINCENZO_82 [Mycobacterium phage Vincenzo]AKF14344.1 hypothetical protein SEA_VINCENZO_82 [Mycobacterium phage Vincenzo]AKF14748.1 hypothetical protein SEA_ALANGRANT_83 [Mycobacterium phage AlanGrant]
MAPLSRIVVTTLVGSTIGVLLATTVLGAVMDLRSAVIGGCLALVVNVLIKHRLDVRQAHVLATQPAVMDPATEVAPGTVMVALVAAWGARPWWAPWRACHTDHLTLAETTVDRPLVMPVRTAVTYDGRFVVHDGAGVLMEVGDSWADQVQPGATVTTVVRTK